MNKLSFTPITAAAYLEALASAGITMAPQASSAPAAQPGVKPAI